MLPDDPTGNGEAARRAEREAEERRRRRRERREDAADAAGDVVDSAAEAAEYAGGAAELGRNAPHVGSGSSAASGGRGGGRGCDGWGGGSPRGGGSGGGDACGACDCNFPLLGVLRLSTVLLVAGALVPTGARRPVLGAIRGYRRRLSRHTPPCPGSPSCSAYALDAVAVLGPRAGLRAAARRVAACGTRADAPA